MQRAAASSPNSKVAHAAIKAANENETARREAATLALRPAAPSANDKDTETRWELSYVAPAAGAVRGLNVADVGYSELGESSSESEAEEEAEEQDAPPATPATNSGRLVFGNFRKTPLDVTPAKAADDSDSDSETETPKRGAVSLRGLTSISNAGNQSAANMTCNSCSKKGHRAAECPKSECYACGKLGHMSADCPNPSSAGRGKRKEAVGGKSGGERKKRKSM